MSLFGTLSPEALPQNPIVWAAAVFMALVVLGIVFLLTYFKRWRWLWGEWLTSLDPKRIGIMYLIAALVMLLRGFIDAAMMRAQQSLSVGASQGYLTPNHFDQIFTAHGTIMIFFAAMGLMWGVINLIVPLQIGSRDVAFPLLNALSLWLFIAGALLVNASLVIGEFAATGWLAYPPLSELAYSPGVGVDYWIWALLISGVGSTLSGINFFTTISTMRAPGMTLMKMPIFVWTVLSAMVLVIFAFPVLTATVGLLFLDRFADMHFFTAGYGGNMMMYVNLIWAWGHPEVYILVLPAFGIYSEIVPVFSQKRLFGYTSMVIATIAITALSFSVWVHHFFTMGAGADVNAFFGIMTMIIAIPTGVKIFNWLFTMYRGRILFYSPMYWFLGFVVLFTIGGMAGVLLAIPGADFQLHNSLFLVAHFHTMIISGVLFGYFAGFTYWFPKFFGFTLDERWGIRAFWCWFIGFLLAFVPLYILGFMGATRRLAHYPAGLGWQGLFIVAAVGVAVIALGALCQIIQVIVSLRGRDLRRAGSDPWNGRTLEWATHTPVPSYSFAHIPSVEARDALWDSKQRGDKEVSSYEAIALPRNSALGLIMGVLSFSIGFGMVWHIFWLAIGAFLGIVLCLMVRSFNEDTEYITSAEEVARSEHSYLGV
ncbi:MAG: cytochrome o ubiquinol oxidase subunit I [Patescibacteria group bacterium]|nr:cytochrome o ubiquinol oxidase subunit I [Patescibacteria group bacterium]